MKQVKIDLQYFSLFHFVFSSLKWFAGKNQWSLNNGLFLLLVSKMPEDVFKASCVSCVQNTFPIFFYTRQSIFSLNKSFKVI